MNTGLVPLSTSPSPEEAEREDELEIDIEDQFVSEMK